MSPFFYKKKLLLICDELVRGWMVNQCFGNVRVSQVLT